MFPPEQFGPLLQKWFQQASKLIPEIPNPAHRQAASDALDAWRSAFEDLQREGPANINAAKAEAEKLQERNQRTQDTLMEQQERRAEMMAAGTKKKPTLEVDGEPLPDWSAYQNIRAELLNRFGKPTQSTTEQRDPGNVWEEWREDWNSE